MIKYVTSGHTFTKVKISEVEVAGETDKFVRLSCGRREAKRSEFRCYFDTREDAKEHLIGIASRKVKVAKSNLETATSTLSEIMKL